MIASTTAWSLVRSAAACSPSRTVRRFFAPTRGGTESIRRFAVSVRRGSPSMRGCLAWTLRNSSFKGHQTASSRCWLVAKCRRQEPTASMGVRRSSPAVLLLEGVAQACDNALGASPMSGSRQRTTKDGGTCQPPAVNEPPTLDEERKAHQGHVAAAHRRTTKMLAAIFVPLLGLVYVVARMIIWRSTTDSYTRLLIRSLDPASWSLAQDGLILLKQVRVAALDTSFLRFVLPFCLVFLVVFVAAAYVQRRVSLLVYDKPALVRHLLMVDRPALATHGAFIRRTGLILLLLGMLCVAGAFLLPSPLVTGFLISALLIMCLAVFTLGFRWIRRADRLGAAKRKVSPAYVRAACISGAVRQLTLVISLVVLVGAAAGLAQWTVAQLGRSHGPAWMVELERWEARVRDHQVREKDDVLLADLRNQVRGTISTLVSGKLDVIQALGPSGVRGLAATFFFIACALACLDIGITLARLEFREPAVALGLGVVAASLLGLAAGGLKSLFPQSAAFSFVAHYGILLLTFVLGRLSAFIIRLYTQPQTECPVCLNPSENPLRCSVCGLRFDRARGTNFVGNKASRELHARECAHVGRIAAERQKTFTSIKEALWAGYDLCGSCLGGSWSAPAPRASGARGQTDA